MKLLINFTLLMMSFVCFSSEQTKATSKTMEELAAMAKSDAEEAVKGRTKNVKFTREEVERRPEVLKKTGGFIDVPAEGTSVVIVDGRENPGGAAQQFSDVFETYSKTNVKIKRTPLNQTNDLVKFAVEIREAENAVYAILIVESEKFSGLTVVPEDRAVVINATRYKGGDDPLQKEVRIVKEIWRGLGFVSGIGYAPFRNDVFQPVFSIKELDALEYQVMQPINFQKMYNTFSKFNVKRSRHVPYRLAVIEGWAAAPTNEYQKAVWDEVKSAKERGPTNPIEIPMPEKK